MKKILYGLMILLIVAVAINSGCGGGSSGGDSGYTGGGGSSTGTTPGTTSTVTYSGTKGYVYVSSTAKTAKTTKNTAAVKASAKQIIVLPTNTTQPSGFIPASGYTVRSSTNSSITTTTDSQGYFNLSASSNSDASPTQNGDGVVVEDPSSEASPVNFPIMGEPMAASELTDIRIVPPFSTTTSEWSIIAGGYEVFFLIGKSGDYWHPVTDSVTWSASESTLGSFNTDWGLFKSNSDISATATGTVQAVCAGTTYSQSIKVISLSEFGSIEGYVKDGSGNAVPRVVVDAISSDTTTTSTDPGFCHFPCFAPRMAMTDSKGYYKIYFLPAGSYNVKVSAYYGSSLAEATVDVSGAVTRDFTVSSVSVNVFGVVKSDKFYYKPGETMSLQVGLMNRGSSEASVTYSAIEFKLMFRERRGHHQPPPTEDEATVVATAVAEGGTAAIEAHGRTLIPTEAVSLTIPETASTDGFYSVEATVTSSSTFRVEPGYMVVYSYVSPSPSPSPSASPSASPSPSPSPSASPSPSPSPSASPSPSPSATEG
ncbi:MAG: carboxypeptidase-like regulatory domain-containing protein [Candidatus Xenobiia bacterium LiM19]